MQRFESDSNCDKSLEDDKEESQDLRDVFGPPAECFIQIYWDCFRWFLAVLFTGPLVQMLLPLHVYSELEF